MNRYLEAIALILFVAGTGLLASCSRTEEGAYPSEDTLPAGIFLEPEERAVLPPGVEIRKVYDDGIEVTKASEGFRSRLYNDAARYCTIAYGHLIKLAPCNGTEPEEFRRGVTEPRGSEILRSDMEKAERAVMTLVDVEMTDGQYAALCDFVFNVGSRNFGSSTLRQVVNARENDRIPFQFRRWVKAGGKEFPGLKVRRQKEIELFFEGLGIPRAAPPPDEDLSLVDIRVGEGR